MYEVQIRACPSQSKTCASMISRGEMFSALTKKKMENHVEVLVIFL